MTADKFKVLLTVIDEGSLSAAAERLGYTPSGVSRMMAALEDDTGFKLLNRSKNGVAPTAECERLLPSVRNMVYYAEQYDQLASDILGLETGTITIGTSYGSYYRWMSELISKFTQAHPNIEVRFIHKNSTLLTDAVISHEADIGIVSYRPGKVKWTLLCEDPLVAWVPEGSPYIEKGYVPIEAFASEPYIEPYPGEDTDNARCFRELGIVPNVRYAVNDTYAAFCLVESGLGITMMNGLTKGDWEGRVAILPVKPARSISIGLISPADYEVSPAVKKFIRFMEHTNKTNNKEMQI